jgi:hypothetical protein
MRPVGWQPSWRPSPSANERKDVDRLLTLLRIVEGEVPPDTLANFPSTELRVLDSYVPIEPNQGDVLFEEVRAWAEEGLRQLAGTGRWIPGVSSLAVVITKNGPQYLGSSEDCAVQYKYAIQQLLMRQAWRVSKCARVKCGKLFIRKGRSEYCNPKCSNAERASRVYAKKSVSAEIGDPYA